MAAPAVPVAALAACAPLFASGRRVEGAVLAALVTGGVLWSNALQYHDAWLAPREQLAELEGIGERFAGEGPALMTEFQPYGVQTPVAQARRGGSVRAPHPARFRCGTGSCWRRVRRRTSTSSIRRHYASTARSCCGARLRRAGRRPTTGSSRPAVGTTYGSATLPRARCWSICLLAKGSSPPPCRSAPRSRASPVLRGRAVWLRSSDPRRSSCPRPVRRRTSRSTCRSGGRLRDLDGRVDSQPAPDGRGRRAALGCAPPPRLPGPVHARSGWPSSRQASTWSRSATRTVVSAPAAGSRRLPRPARALPGDFRPAGDDRAHRRRPTALRQAARLDRGAAMRKGQAGGLGYGVCREHRRRQSGCYNPPPAGA